MWTKNNTPQDVQGLQVRKGMEAYRRCLQHEQLQVLEMFSWKSTFSEGRIRKSAFGLITPASSVYLKHR